MCSLCFATAVHGGSQLWLSRSGHTAVRFYVVNESAVIQASGPFDNDAITPCRAALDAATNTPYPIVLDLHAVDPPGRVSVALVGAIRRYAKVRGPILTLTNMHEPWVDALAAAGVAHWHDANSTGWFQDSR
jgi:hypothetical protein